MTGPVDILRTLYNEVLTLESCLHRMFGDGSLPTTLLQEGDPDSYRSLLHKTLVGLPREVRQFHTSSVSQHLHQKEVILKAIEHIMKRDGPGKNVLTFGFGLMSDDQNAHISSGLNIEYKYPNNNVSRLHYQHWKQLHSRIGDETMMYLLENLSLFVEIRPTCYLQLTGPPVYNMWTYETRPSLWIPTNPTKRAADMSLRTRTRKNPSTRKRCRHAGGVRKSPNSLGKDHPNVVCSRVKTDKINAVSTADIKTAKCWETTKVRTSGKSNYNAGYVKQKVPQETSVPNSGNSNNTDYSRANKRRKFEIGQDDQRFVKLKQESEAYARQMAGNMVCNGDSSRTTTSASSNCDKHMDICSETVCDKVSSDVIETLVETENKEIQLEVNDGKPVANGTPHLTVIAEDHNESREHKNHNITAGPAGHTETTHRDTGRKRKMCLNISADIGQEAKRRKTSNGLNGDSQQKGIATASEHKLKVDDNASKQCNVRPFSHSLLLPRAKIFYKRNVRQRFPKTAALSVASVGKRGGERLYREILLTPVHTSTLATPIHITLPPSHMVAGSSPSLPDVCHGGANQLEDKTHPANHVVAGSSHVLDGSGANNQPTVNTHSANNVVSGACHESGTDCQANVHTSNANNDRNRESHTIAEGDKSEYCYTKLHPSFNKTLYGIANSATDAPEKTDTNSAHVETCGKAVSLEVLNTVTVNSSLHNPHYISRPLGKDSDITTAGQTQYPGSSGHILDTDPSHGTLSCSHKVESPQPQTPCDKYSHVVKDPENVSYPASSRQQLPGRRDLLYTRRLSIIQQRQAAANGQSLNPELCLSSRSLNLHEAVDIQSESLSTSSVVSPAALSSNPYASMGTSGITVTKPDTEEDGHMSLRETTQLPSQDLVTVPVLTELLALLEDLIHRHRKCPYRSLLRHYCNPRSLGRRGSVTKSPHAARMRAFTKLKDKRRTTPVSMATLLADHVHHRNVYLFLRACITRIFPPQLLGSSHNRNQLLRNTSRLVSMGKFDKLCLGELMDRMKTKECAWLKQVPVNNLRLYVLAKVIHWIFTGYVFPLLQTYFYITDTTFLRYKMLYYRQPVWQRLHTLALNNLLQKKMMKLVSEPRLHQLLSEGALGVSTLRFLPKPRSLRPIINMGSTAATQDKGLSVNNQLLDTHQILSYIKERNPTTVGYGQFGMDDVHRAWQQYGRTWRELGRPPLYFVKTDVTDCYDSILQHQLYGTLQQILDMEAEDEYVIRKFVTVMATRGRLKRSFHRQVTPFSAYTPDFTGFVQEWVDRRRCHDMIIVDKVVNQHESRESILELLKAHLFTNIIKVGSQHYIQTSGISQGSVISMLLCNFYYAPMERPLFDLDSSDLLLRMVDDYLLVTPSRPRAQDFLHQMLAGIPEFNCRTNVTKVLTNFAVTADSQMADIPNIGDEEWFPWCGMFFNTRTLAVRADYTRYQAVRIRDTVTIDLVNRPGAMLKDKLLGFAQPKCHMIFMDAAINSVEQICSNCYQLFLLAAFKFHAIVKKLPQHRTGRPNTRYLTSVIQDLGSYVYHQTRHKTGAAEMPRCDSNVVVIKRNTVMLLCLRAFHLKLGIHRSAYHTLVNNLRARVRRIEGRLDPDLAYRIRALCGTTLPPGFDLLLN